MKNRGNNKKLWLIILLTVVPVAIVAILSLLGMKELKKSYALDEGINNIVQYVDSDDNPTSVSFVLEYLDHNTKENIANNTVKVTAPSGIELKFLDVHTNEEIEVTNYTIALGTDGVVVKLNGIEKNNKYNVMVEPVEKRTGLMPSYKSANIEIDYTDGLKAYVKELRDKNNNVVDLSENDKMVFVYTDSEDKIKLRGNEDVEISYYYSLDELSDEELATKEFVTYDKNNYLKVSTNGYLYAKSRYKTNGYSSINSIHITNIDKLNPSINIDSVVLNDTQDQATITYTINDATATKEYGKSGIVKYAFTNSEYPEESDYIETTGDGTYTATVEENGIYYFHAKDAAGNYISANRQVDVIDPIEREPVLLILQSSNFDLVGNVYRSLHQLHDDLEAHGLTTNDEIIVQLEGNITNQHMIVENVNMTLDLNGYQIYSKDNVPAFNVKNGSSLKIVDNKYEIDKYIEKHGSAICSNVTDPINYSYTGDVQEFTAPRDGTYKFEVWGAAGGKSRKNGTIAGTPGKGGYSKGTIELNANDKFYVYVGQKGTDAQIHIDSPASFNGVGSFANSSYAEIGTYSVPYL